MNYEWDAGKAASNLTKHGVSFEDAATVFLDPLAMTFSDPAHSVQEHHEITIGHTRKRELVFVAHMERRDRIRIVSARRVTRAERRQYEEGTNEEA